MNPTPSSEQSDHNLDNHHPANHQLAKNIIHFARILRRAGLPVGPSHVVDAVAGVELAGIKDKEVFFWTLHAFFVRRQEHFPVFEAAFKAYWRVYDMKEKMLEMLSPQIQAPEDKKKEDAAALRVKEAMQPDRPPQQPLSNEEIRMDAQLTFSAQEKLQSKDFDQMSADEILEAQRAIRDLVLPNHQRVTRRYKSHPQGTSIHMRASLKQSMRHGGEMIKLARQKRRMRETPIVALIDISGSMSNYSRVLLHFMHALAEKRPHVQTFLFGTRLSNITRELRRKDPDEALALCAEAAPDWSGGTLIAQSLEEFNRFWSRRVLTSHTTFLLFTDGLERDTGNELDFQMDRLKRSVKKLIWLNPLLRFDGFEPRAQGIRMMLKHVDELRSVHSLDAVSELIEALDSRNRRANMLHEWDYTI